MGPPNALNVRRSTSQPGKVINMFRVFWIFAAAALSPAFAADWIGIRPDGFVLSSGARFVPWGFNYDRDYRFRLLEEYWAAEWPAVERDFRAMKRLGANVVRLHLQLGAFLDAPDRPDAANLARLEKLVRLAEDLGIYLDVTGLATTRESAVPAWYNRLDESGRWAAQARFWEAIAATCAARPGVFAFNLMNEPLVSAGRRPPGAWIHPAAIQGLHYLEYLNLDPAGRARPEIACAWIRRMTEAIRRRDPRHLITVGLVLIGDKPEEAAGFPPARIAPEVGFLALHLYPEKGKLDAALATLARYRAFKPALIEETFPLHCSVKELGEFIERSRPDAAGWIGHYWGQTPEELESSTVPRDVLTYRWLQLFQALNPNRQAR
jgi:sugar phosphate isomerase/epimerase